MGLTAVSPPAPRHRGDSRRAAAFGCGDPRIGRYHGLRWQNLGPRAKAPQITVCASVAFAWFWLMPRLEQFSALQPDIDLRVLATDQPVLAGPGEVDVAILFGAGQWEGCTRSFCLAKGSIRCAARPICATTPNCAPARRPAGPDAFASGIAASRPGGRGLADWLLRQGVTGSRCGAALRFNSYPMVLQAAEAGHGVALGWSYITDPLLAEGRLVCPVDHTLETQDRLLPVHIQTMRQYLRQPRLFWTGSAVRRQGAGVFA